MRTSRRNKFAAGLPAFIWLLDAISLWMLHLKSVNFYTCCGHQNRLPGRTRNAPAVARAPRWLGVVEVPSSPAPSSGWPWRKSAFNPAKSTWQSGFSSSSMHIFWCALVFWGALFCGLKTGPVNWRRSSSSLLYFLQRTPFLRSQAYTLLLQGMAPCLLKICRPTKPPTATCAVRILPQPLDRDPRWQRKCWGTICRPWRWLPEVARKGKPDQASHIHANEVLVNHGKPRDQFSGMFLAETMCWLIS